MLFCDVCLLKLIEMNLKMHFWLCTVILSIYFFCQDLNQQDDDPLRKLQNQKNIVQCRICKGDHWTLKCPYKDTLEPLQQQLKEDENAGSILFPFRLIYV